MRIAVAIALSALFAAPLAGGVAQDPILEIGYVENPPYSFTNRFGKADGKLVKALHLALEKSGIRFVTKPFPYSRLLHRLGRGETHLYVGPEDPGLAANAMKSFKTVTALKRTAYSLMPLPANPDTAWWEKNSFIILKSNRALEFEETLLEKFPGKVYLVRNHRGGMEMLLRGRADVFIGYADGAGLGDGGIQQRDLEDLPCFIYVSRVLREPVALAREISARWPRGVRP